MSELKRLDGLGRIVIPKRIRKNLGFNDSEVLEIENVGSKIIIQKAKKNTLCRYCEEQIETLDSYCRFCGKDQKEETEDESNSD